MRKDYMKEERNLDQSNGIVYITAIPRNMTIFVMGLYFLYFIESVYHIVSKHFSVYCVIFRFNAFPLSLHFGSFLILPFTIEIILLKMSLILNWYHNKITNGRCIQVVEIRNRFVIILQQLYLIQWCYTLHGIIYGKLR